MKAINTKTLQDARNKQTGLPVVNVLGEKHFEHEHIKGSTNIPLADPKFEEKVEKIAGSKQAPVVVYCASTECDMSLKAAKTLEQAGFEMVYDYEGGTKAWKDAGLPVESGV